MSLRDILSTNVKGFEALLMPQQFFLESYYVRHVDMSFIKLPEKVAWQNIYSLQSNAIYSGHYQTPQNAPLHPGSPVIMAQ